jgi:hypothetical protein
MSDTFKLETNDPEIISLINFYDTKKRDIVALKALKIGLIALKDMETAGNVDYVEKEFNKLKVGIDKSISKLDENLELKFEEAEKLISDKLTKNFDPETGIMSRILDNYLGDGGKLSDLFDENNSVSAVSKIKKIMSEYFDEDASKIVKLLDSNNEKSPFKSFKKDLVDRLVGIQAEIKAMEAAKIATKATAQKGTQKGIDYQEFVHSELEEIANVLGDTCMPTTEEQGQILNCKTGDTVIKLNPRETGGANVKIVFEAKDKVMSLKDILSELDTAMKNRDSRLSIAVLSGKDVIKDVSANIGSFRDYPPNKILCLFDKEEYDRCALEVAYKLARSKLIFGINSKEMKSDSIDLAEVNRVTDEIIRKLNDFTVIQSSLTKANGAISDAKTKTENMRLDLSERLNALSDLVTPLTSSN